MVSYTLKTLPVLTEDQETQLRELAARPESEIDYSDIPPVTREMLKDARRGAFYQPVQRQITAHVDADVLEWLKGKGNGYESRINAILRREMLAEFKHTEG